MKKVLAIVLALAMVIVLPHAQATTVTTPPQQKHPFQQLKKHPQKAPQKKQARSP